MAITKGFITDWKGQRILPITRAELVLDQDGNPAFTSKYFEVGYNGNEYGLISAAELDLIKGSGTGQGISGIYTKLDLINTGLYFNNTALNFYDAGANATPIKIGSDGDGAINIALNNNNVNLSLVDLQAANTIAGQIIKNITVDNFGRVVSVSGGALTNDEIPDTLTGKTLDECKVNIVPNVTNAIPNKAYVDQKFTQTIDKAIGALKFGGPLRDATTANNALTNKDAWNNYYKVVQTFNIAASDVFEYSGNDLSVSVKKGDTLIIYSSSDTASRAQFVHIPSGDDVTSITVKRDDEPGNTFIGHVSLEFSSPFKVVEDSLNGAYISLSPASGSNDGYLSASDYTKFSSYGESLKVSYSGLFTEENANLGRYKIGTLTIGGVATDVIAQNNISALQLNNGATDEYNPILKFTETDATDVDITFKGTNGVVVKKNGNNVEFGANNTILEDSTSYLKVENGSRFGVKLGSFDEDGNVIEGLANFSTVHYFALQIAKKTQFESISYSLKGDANEEEYRYGNAKLIEAITITI